MEAGGEQHAAGTAFTLLVTYLARSRQPRHSLRAQHYHALGPQTQADLLQVLSEADKMLLASRAPSLSQG